MNDDFAMPIQTNTDDDCFFRFQALQAHESQAAKNHSQSLRQLKKRGGLSFSEMAAIMERRPFITMTNSQAIKILEKLGTLNFQ